MLVLLSIFYLSRIASEIKKLLYGKKRQAHRSDSIDDYFFIQERAELELSVPRKG
jgi:hypothetical protein